MLSSPADGVVSEHRVDGALRANYALRKIVWCKFAPNAIIDS